MSKREIVLLTALLITIAVALGIMLGEVIAQISPDEVATAETTIYNKVNVGDVKFDVL